MHDPMTVAFELRYPWRDRPTKLWPKGYRHVWLTIWHVDPETDGTDDSCGWSAPKFSEEAALALEDLVTNPDDNVQWLFEGTGNSVYDTQHAVYVIARQAQRILAPRPWYRHPRWHVHHWRLQFHPLQKAQRWLFSRCAHCGERFAWGYAPTTYQWDNGGPRWFKSEVGVYHHHCLPRMMVPCKLGPQRS